MNYQELYNQRTEKFDHWLKLQWKLKPSITEFNHLQNNSEG